MLTKIKALFQTLASYLNLTKTEDRTVESRCEDYVVFWCESLEDGFARKKEKYPQHEFLQYLEYPGGARLSKMVLRKNTTSACSK